MKHVDSAYAICKKAAKEDPTCILSFSRGKDSLAAWIIAKDCFQTVLPFHLSIVPHIPSVTEDLNYYEKVFKTKILRLMNGETFRALYGLWFQDLRNEEDIETANFPTWYAYTHVAKRIRKEYKINSWLVTGELATDSAYIAQKLKRTQGFNKAARALYPLWNWTEEQVMDFVDSKKIQYSADYRLGFRSIHDMPTLLHLENMRKDDPSYYERFKLAFPFIDAHLARNEFRRKHLIEEK